MSDLNHSEKLAQVAGLEKSGVLQRVIISAMRSDCPFCFSVGNFNIVMHSRNYGVGYSCSVCGEVGGLGQLAQNLREAKRPEAITLRADGKSKKRELSK